jgi:hypothetical protein
MNTTAFCRVRVDTSPFVGGGRYGTVRATRAQLTETFGQPLAVDAGGKVTYGWVIDTPRGQAAVRDYWWNGADEHSIAAPSRIIGRWAVRWLTHNGFTAHRGTP